MKRGNRKTLRIPGMHVFMPAAAALLLAVLLLHIDAKASFAVENEVIYPGTPVTLATAKLSAPGDDGYGPVDIGFDFKFYGTTYRTIYVGVNGILTFDPTTQNLYTNYSKLSDPLPFNLTDPTDTLIYSTPFPLSIAAHFDDLTTQQSPAGSTTYLPTVYYNTVGTAPNRKCIIQWTNMFYFTRNVQIGTFQAILYEGTNKIQIQYRTLIDGSTSDGENQVHEHASFGSFCTVGIVGAVNRDPSTSALTSVQGKIYTFNGTATVPLPAGRTYPLWQGQAITFTPNSDTSDYVMNGNDTYDPVYLSNDAAPPVPAIDPSAGISNGGISGGTSATLAWGADPSAKAQSYNVYVSTSQDFSATSLVGGTPATVNSPSTSYQATGLTLGQTYYWQVEAYSGQNGTGYMNTSPTYSFTATGHTLTATAGTGGTISPSIPTPVADGGSQTYTITPNAGYRVLDVTVDGTSVGAVTSYTFTNVTANHAIAATFQKTWQLTTTAGTGGSITPAGTTTVDDGSSQTITITPASGYAIQDVTVNGVSQGAVASLPLTVTADTTVQATFAAVSTQPSNSGSGSGSSGSTSVTPNTTTTQAGAGVVLTPTPVAGATTYEWDFGNGQTQAAATANPMSYDYPMAGAYTVTLTAENASGAALSTATTSLKVNFGQVEVAPNQGATGNAVVKATETLSDITGTQLQTQYGVTDTTMQPLRKASTFTATLSEDLKPAVFRISLYDVPVAVNTLRLVKLKSNGTNKEYTYGSSASIDKDGYWWITDAQGFDVPLAATLAANTLYYVNFVIQDNGPFDANPEQGQIVDPVTIAESAAPAAAGGSGDGGCVYGPAGAGVLDLLLLLGAGAGLAVRRRMRR